MSQAMDSVQSTTFNQYFFFLKSKYHIKYHSPSKGTKLNVVKFKIMDTFLNMYHSTAIYTSCFSTDILKQLCSKIEKNMYIMLICLYRISIFRKIVYWIM